MNDEQAPPTPKGPELARFLSIGTKLSIGVLVVVIVLAALVFFSLTKREREGLLTAEQRAGQMVTDLVVGAAVAPLEFEDAEVMGEELERLRRNDAVNYASVWRQTDDGLVQLAEYRADRYAGEQVEPPEPSQPQVQRLEDEMIFTAPVIDPNEGATLGIAQVRLSLARQNEAFAASRRLILLGSAGAAGTLLILLIGFVRRIVVRPLADLGDAAQRVEQGERGRVEVVAHDEVGQLALAFNRMAEAISERELRIATANRQLQRLLDNMRQAIFSFGSDMKIRGNHSRATLDIFRRGRVEGLDVRDELLSGHGPESHEAEAVRMWFDMVFEIGADGWGEIVKLAPTHLTLRPNQPEATDLALSFRPVIEDGQLREIIVLATDETERNEIERQAKEWQTKYAREMAAMQKIVSGGTQMFVQFLRSTEDRLGRIRHLLERSSSLRRGELDELFRHAHTVKGEARTFDLADLHKTATRLEDQLGRLRRWIDEERKIDWEPMLEETLVLLGQVREAFEGTRDLLIQASPLGSAILEQTTVFQSDLDELISAVREDSRRAATWPGLAQIVERLGSRPFAEVAMRLVEAVPTWADAEGKRARLEIYGGETRVPAGLAEKLSGPLTHLVRNAVAHGIELPSDRRSAGKSEIGVIRLRCRQLDGGVEIVVEDDGRGLDVDAIVEQASARGLASVGAVPANLIFVPGLTTGSSASGLSGRGVGLHSVRNDMTEVGYVTAVASEPGKGLTVTIAPSAQAGKTGKS